MPISSDDNLTQLLEAIGYVATGWAKLEHSINQAIWALTAISDEDGACITAQIPAILPRMRALIALAHRNGCSDGTLTALNKFSGKIDGIARRRNRVIHDSWFVKTDKSTFGRLEITADRKLVFEIIPQTPGEILSVAHEITDAREEFKKLRSLIADSLAGSVKERIGSRLQADLESLLDQQHPSIET